MSAFANLPFLKSSFVRHAATLVKGVALANLIGLAVRPIITRLYDPTAFGLFTLLAAIATVVFRSSALSLEQAVVIAPENRTARVVLALCTVMVIVVCVAIGVLVIFTKPRLAILFGANFADHVWLLPILVLVRGSLFVLSFGLVRQKQFAAISQAMLVEALIGGAAKVGFGLSWPDTGVLLIVGGAIGAGCGVAVHLYNLRKSKSLPTFANLNKEEVGGIVSRYREFPIYGVPTVTLNSFVQNAMPMLFAVAFTPAIVGFYGLAYRTVNLPSRYLGTSLQRVYLQKAAEDRKRGRSLVSSMAKATGGLAALTLVPFVVLFVYGEELFALVFGEGWETAGRYAEILAPGLYFTLLNTPAHVVYTVLERLRARFVYTLVYSAARLGAIAGAVIIYGTPEMCLRLYNVVLILFNLVFIGYAFLLAGRDDP